MNEKVLRHKEICDGLNELYARKNHDYGDSFHTTFVEEGLAMARIRLGDKFSRFKTLSRLSCNDRDQQQVTDESIRDTLLDLANYAIMTVLEMDAPDEGWSLHRSRYSVRQLSVSVQHLARSKVSKCCRQWSWTMWEWKEQAPYRFRLHWDVYDAPSDSS